MTFTNNTKRIFRNSVERTLEELKHAEASAASEFRRKAHQAQEAAKRLGAIRRDIADAKASLLELRNAPSEPTEPLEDFTPDWKRVP